jgi:glycosyltransferase involved in cell wall biosynthesis
MITYGITVCDEAYEMRRLLDSLLPFLAEGEKIIALADSSKVTEEIKDICNYHSIPLYFFDFNGNFSEFKNELIKLTKTKYLFQLDADEQVTPSLLSCIRSILIDGIYDCIWVPRVNIVYNHSEEDVKEFNWNKNGNWIQFPDYQIRIFEVNDSIHWHLPVHEEVIGYKNNFIIRHSHLEFFSIIHVKTIDKQKKQNKIYKLIQ